MVVDTAGSEQSSTGETSVAVAQPSGKPVDLPPSEKPSSAPPAGPRQMEMSYPNGLLQALLIIALLLAMFLVALDMSIIATAIPTITVQFHRVDQVGWYGSAFFMCLAAFQAFWGKAYKYFPLKIVFLACIAVFEIGSLVIALAPSSPAVIVGRAIQGAGGAGVTAGCYIICAFITRPQRLPAVMGLFGTVWSCSSIIGPLLGGVFTERVTWRWCFWINLPIGGATMAIILLFFKTPQFAMGNKAAAAEILSAFDFPGMVLVLGALVCFCLALEDGGITHSWKSSIPIGLLIGFCLLLIVFTLWEWKQAERAMLVPRIMKRRSIAACAAFNFFAQAGGFARVYNLPLYFQASQGVSPAESGIRTLPSVLTISIFSFASSAGVGKLGYYQVFLWAGGIFMTIGSALIYTLEINSPASHYIGYQVVAGIGMGLVIQVPVIVAQNISPRPDVAVTIACSMFFQFFGGAVGVSSAQSIMNNRLIASLPANSTTISASRVLAAGATGLRRAFPDSQDLQAVLRAYMIGLKGAWIFSIVMGGLAFLCAFTAEWKSVNSEHVKARNAAKTAAAAPATPSSN